MANRINDQVVIGVEITSGMNGFTSSAGKVKSAYDCCVANMFVPGSVGWLWNSETMMCYEVELNKCVNPSKNGNVASLVAGKGDFGYVFGNGICGMWTKSVMV
jgi:hypothetical protein